MSCLRQQIPLGEGINMTTELPLSAADMLHLLSYIVKEQFECNSLSLQLKRKKFCFEGAMCTICFPFTGDLPKSSGLQAPRTNVSAVPQRHSTELTLLQEDNYSSLNYIVPPKPWATPEPPEAVGLGWTLLGLHDS